MAKLNKNNAIPTQLEIELPDKKYFTIGEVADLCQLKSHVLRYWEQVFPQLEPSKRRGRRYYQRVDVELVLEIKSLLHDQGFTIPGAKARLSRKGSEVKRSDLSEQDQSAFDQLSQIKEELQQFKQYIQNRF